MVAFYESRNTVTPDNSMDNETKNDRPARLQSLSITPPQTPTSFIGLLPVMVLSSFRSKLPQASWSKSKHILRFINNPLHPLSGFEMGNITGCNGGSVNTVTHGNGNHITSPPVSTNHPFSSTPSNTFAIVGQCPCRISSLHTRDTICSVLLLTAYPIHSG